MSNIIFDIEKVSAINSNLLIIYLKLCDSQHYHALIFVFYNSGSQSGYGGIGLLRSVVNYKWVREQYQH